MNIGERIKNRRIELELSQTDLAQRMGLKNRASVCRDEKSTGEQMTRKTLKAYAEALHCSPLFLMGLTDNPASDAALVLSDDEKQLIIEYRKAPEHDRQMIRRLLAYYEGINK